MANKFSIHAEKHAIMNLSNKNIHLLKNCMIYIVKIKNNKKSCAIPCEKCTKLLIKYKCKGYRTIN